MVVAFPRRKNERMKALGLRNSASFFVWPSPQTWCPNQRCFKVSEAQKLTGKLAHLTKEANWVFHLLSHLYLSIAYALFKNKRLLTESSAEFQDIILAIQTNAFLTHCKDLARHTSFPMKRAAKLTHHASYQYNINKTMHYKIKFFCNKLKPDSGIEWETPIAHLIHQTPFEMTTGDSLLEVTGGFSTTLGFWWHICFPDEVVQRTLRFKTNNNNSMLVLINVFEFVMVITVPLSMLFGHLLSQTIPIL
jgi:hypothetical protein